MPIITIMAKKAATARSIIDLVIVFVHDFVQEEEPAGYYGSCDAENGQKAHYCLSNTHNRLRILLISSATPRFTRSTSICCSFVVIGSPEMAISISSSFGSGNLLFIGFLDGLEGLAALIAVQEVAHRLLYMARAMRIAY